MCGWDFGTTGRATSLPDMIQVEDLEVVYPTGTRALAATTLGFEPGRFTVLLGASGAGKSTLLRTLNGLVKPTAGRVMVEGIGVLRGSRDVRMHRRRTGMVFQQHQLIGRATRPEQRADGTPGLPFRPAHPAAAAGGGEAPRARRDRAHRVDRLCLASRRPALGRPAAARRHRACSRAGADADPRRRAGREPRSRDRRSRARPAAYDLQDGRHHRRSSACISSNSRAAMPSTSSGSRTARVVFDGPPAKLGAAEINRIYGTVRRRDDETITRKTGTYA